MEDKINKILDAMSDDVYIKRDELTKSAFKDGYSQGYEDAVKKACEAFCIESKCRNRVNLACRQTCEKRKCFREAMEVMI